jgi:REP element-mobilizing transposase RayT
MAPPPSKVKRGRMPRQRRLHLPHVGFHITARTQNGAQYFTPDIRTLIAQDIEEAIAMHKHTLLAYVVMPNHIHIVLKQGYAPLGWMMQRIMQRAVVHVRRVHGGQGHVFGRPYWSGACPNPAYVRRAIVYTHMNPVKADLCKSTDRYAWSTHRYYMTSREREKTLVQEGLMLFANTSVQQRDVRHNYMKFIKFCEFQRAKGVPGDWLLPEGPDRMLIPPAAHGDTYWAANYSSFVEASSFTRVNVDVARPAASLLLRIDPNVTLDMIRAADRSEALCRIRRQLIEGLVIHGCRTSAIGRCLGMSASLVSRIKRDMSVRATSTE